MNEPGVMSDIDAFSTPTTAALPVSVMCTSPPVRDLTDSTLPSSLSMVPRTRVLCACAAPTIRTVATAAAAARDPNQLMWFLLEKKAGASRKARCLVAINRDGPAHIGGVTPRPTL